MTPKSIICLAAACLLLVSTSLPAQIKPSSQQVQRLDSLPLSFEPNRGQTSPQVQWVARGPEYTLFLSGSDAVLEMSHISPPNKLGESQPAKKMGASSAALQMSLLGATPSPVATGEQPQPGRANYFTGADPKNWQRDVPMFGQVRLSQVYPGIDLTYYGKQGHLEYDFVLAPGADAATIRLGFQGATPTLTSNGDLRLKVGDEQVTLGRPVVFQTVDQLRRPVEASFEVASNHEVTFHLGAYDHSRTLTIDPVLLFDGTFGSGGRDTVANALTVDSLGEIILTGATHDLTFPTTTGTIQPTCGTSAETYLRCTDVTDAFVTKISADGGSLVFSTYLSGTQYNEVGTGIAVDAAGIIYAVGNTDSVDFPVTSDAFQKLCSPIGINPVNNIFTGVSAGCGATIVNVSMYLLKINAAGNQILYGTFLGGTQSDQALGVSLDPAGNIYVAGVSSSTFSTYPNGDNNITYPTTPSAFQTFGANGNFYATLAKFSNDGHTLLYSTFLGGVVSNPHTDPTDHTYTSSLAVGQNGVAFLGGETFAFAFPTTAGVLKPTCAPVTVVTKPWSCGQITGFVSAIDTTKSGTASLVYSTFIGPPSNATGSGDHYALTYVNGLLADSSNDVYVTGNTQAFNFPTTAGAFQTSCPYSSNPTYCNAATYLAKINPTGAAFLFSTFYSGPDQNNDYGSGQSLASDAQGRIYLYGVTRGGCNDLPVVNSIQPACSSGNKIFIAAFSPDGTQLLFGTRFGSPADYEAAFTSSGIALDASGNIYFGGLTTSASFPTTAGTYTQTRTGGQQRTFFGKISPVLSADTTTLAISPATTFGGQAVTFTATVTGTSQTSPAPTGSVTLINTGVTPVVTIGTIQLVANGSGTFTSSSLAGGTYQVVALYNADNIYDFSMSQAQPLTISSRTGDTVTLTIAATTIKVGSSTTFNVTVAGATGTAVPTGNVSFLDGSTPLGSAALVNGAASFSTTALAVGSHSISVNYAGDTAYGPASSISQTVTVGAYAAALNFSATPVLALPGATIALNTNISGSTGVAAPTGSLTILDGTTPVISAAIAGATVNLSTTALAAGTHVLSASYSGDGNYAPSASSSVTVVIRAAAATTTLLSSSGLSVNKGSSITFTAAVGSQVATGNPTGTVTFYDGTSAIGTGSVVSTVSGSGSATLTTTSLAAGTHSINAVYGGDMLFLTSSSTAIAQVVIAPGYTIAASPNPLIIQSGQSGTTTLTVTPSGGYTGTLTFACAGLPQNASCAFNPASLALTSISGVATDTLSVSTMANHALLQVPSRPFGDSARTGALCALFGLPLGLFGLLALGKGGPHRNGLPKLLMFAVIFFGLGTLTLLSGCGGGSASSPSAAPGTYAISLSIASSDGTTQNLNLSIQIK